MIDLKSGDNILPPGNYGDLALAGMDGITIKAQDPKNPPVFNSVVVKDCRSINFGGVKFKWVAEAGVPSYFTPNEISASSDITFTDCTRVGSIVGGVPIGRGMMIGPDVSRVKFIRDTARNWESILMNLGTDVSVDRARWINTSNDIIQCNGVQGFSLTNSFLGYFKLPIGIEAHPDFFQLQMYDALRRAQDILISNCFLHSGPGSETAQGIFLGHEDLFKPEAPTFGLKTQNVTITDNTIYAGHCHGISAYGVDGADIGNNTLIYNPAVTPKGFSSQTYWPGIDQAYSENLNIHDNIAASCPPGKNNMILLPGDYPKYFGPEVMQPNCPPSAIRALQGGLIQLGKAGSSAVRGA